MNDRCTFSIIIPTYNRAHLIIKTLDSIKNQNFKNYELIVVDDGSKDDTQLVIEDFIKRHNLINWKYFYKENGERGAARNYGIAKATGQWITFLDSDDWLYSNHFQTAYEFICSFPNINIFHSAYEFKNELGEYRKSVMYPKNNDINNELLKGNLLSCFGMFIKKELLSRNNFCEERGISGSEDWLLWLKLSARYKIHLQPKRTGCMILHSERSVLRFRLEQMLERSNLLILYLNSDLEFVLKYGKCAINRIHGHMMTYMALHLVMLGQKKLAVRYFVKGVSMSSNELFSRRTLAVFKYLFIK